MPIDRYFEIFTKAAITASGITFVAGVVFTIRVMFTYTGTLESIEGRIKNIENSQAITDQKTNAVYNYFIMQNRTK